MLVTEIASEQLLSGARQPLDHQTGVDLAAIIGKAFMVALARQVPQRVRELVVRGICVTQAFLVEGADVSLPVGDGGVAKT